MRNRSASGANVRFHTFVFVFFPQQSVEEEEHVRASGRALSAQVTCPTSLSHCVAKPRRQTQPPLPSSSFYSLPSSTLEDPLPLNPASCPSVLTCVPPYLLIYDLISSPRAHSRCVKGPLFALYGAIVLQKNGPLAQPSVFDLYSRPSAARRKGNLRFTSRRSPQIFRSFYQQMAWLCSRSASLRPRTPGILALAAQGGNPVSMFASQQEFAHRLRCRKFNPRSAMPDTNTINQRGLEERPALLDFFLNSSFF